MAGALYSIVLRLTAELTLGRRRSMSWSWMEWSWPSEHNTPLAWMTMCWMVTQISETQYRDTWQWQWSEWRDSWSSTAAWPTVEQRLQTSHRDDELSIVQLHLEGWQAYLSSCTRSWKGESARFRPDMWRRQTGGLCKSWDGGQECELGPRDWHGSGVVLVLYNVGGIVIQ